MNKSTAPSGNSTPPHPESLLNVADLARIFKVSDSTIRRWCRNLLIDHIQVERKYLFEPISVENFKIRFRKQRGSR